MKKLITACVIAACLVVAPLSAEAASVSKADIQRYAKVYVTGKSTAHQWTCFYKVIAYESGWNHRAQNGRYYGLGQMANAKARHSGKPYLQVRDAWKYMVNRYSGKACGAWSHIERVGWY